MSSETGKSEPVTVRILDREYTVGVSDGERASLTGAQWQALEAALADANPYPLVLRACALCAGELKVQLRTLLQHHCGQSVLRTRQLMMDIQSL